LSLDSFYCSWKGKCHFTNVTGKRPSLFFLPFPIQDVVVLDSYNDLIFCWCVGFRYVVCNPMTKKWLVLPDSICSAGQARLGFDLTVSLHFQRR
jgi:hypothetical protein